MVWGTKLRPLDRTEVCAGLRGVCEIFIMCLCGCVLACSFLSVLYVEFGSFSP